MSTFYQFASDNPVLTIILALIATSFILKSLPWRRSGVDRD